MSRLSAEIRADLARAFSSAKQFISPTFAIGDMEQFICHALVRAHHAGHISARAYHEATHIISERLGQHNCVEGFLFRKVGWKSVSDAGRDAIQQYRLRWLDALIEEYSK